MSAVRARQRPPSRKTGTASKRAIGSAVEHSLHTGGVTGSIPVSPTIFLLYWMMLMNCTLVWSLEHFFSYFLFPLLSGMLGWVSVNILLMPLLNLQKLRSEIHEADIYFANAFPPMTDDDIALKEEWTLAKSKFRYFASKLGALASIDCFWAKTLNYDTKKAARNFIGLSNTNNREGRQEILKAIREALKLSDNL